MWKCIDVVCIGLLGVLECFVVIIFVVDVICGGFVAFLETDRKADEVTQVRKNKTTKGDHFFVPLWRGW